MKRNRSKRIFALMLIVLITGMSKLGVAQQINYEQRELKAPTAVKTRLAQLRAEAKAKGQKFRIVYTSAMDRSLDQLTGLVVPRDFGVKARQQNILARKLDTLDNTARDAFAKQNNVRLPELDYVNSVNARAFDWRKQGKVTAVRDQNPCGSCWAFAAIGAYEGSYLLRNDLSVDASEQDVLDCSNAGTCKGGWHTTVFDYLIAKGNAYETSYAAYTATQGTCNSAIATPLRAVAWGYVTDDFIPGTSNQRMPTVRELKNALVTYGPLAITVLATPQFQAYGGDEPFNEPKSANETYMDSKGNTFKVDADGHAYTVDPVAGKSYYVNHGITLIGWDDSKHSWLIKNSWGTNWGETGGYGTERGYMWIDYGTNNVGYAAAWVKAKSNKYLLPPTYMQMLKASMTFKPMPDELKSRPIQVGPSPHTPGGPVAKPVTKQVNP